MMKHTALTAILAAAMAVPSFAAQEAPVYNLDAQRANTTGTEAKPAVQRTKPAQQRQAAPQQQQQQRAPALSGGNINEILQYGRELRFTDDQVRSIQAVINEFEPVATKYDAEMRIARFGLSNALRKDAPDFATAQEKIKGLTDTQFQFRLAMLDAYRKLYELMTPEQKTKYLQLITSSQETTAARRQTMGAAPAKKTAQPPAAPRNSSPAIDLSDDEN